MSCNACSKTFSLLRPEKGCPGCGFSYCSKCLNNKIFLNKINSEAKVCGKCKNAANSKEVKIKPPDAYFKRIGAIDTQTNSNKMNSNQEQSMDPIEEEIRIRLQKLKDSKQETLNCTDNDIADRLKTLKDVPTTSQAEIEQRLANLKNIPVQTLQNKPIIPCTDLRTEEEQANDLMRQYMEQTSIDKKYKDEFEEKVSDIEMRLQKLKGSADSGNQTNVPETHDDSGNEEETTKKIIEKAKKEALSEHDTPSATDELPFCEICNEDAKMRCLGCKYLFCKRCFLDHRDEDDGCDQYENYTAPKSFEH